MTGDRWTQIGFARAAGVVAARAGLTFAPSRQPAAEQAMRRVMEDAGLRQPSALAERLARDPAMLDALLAEVTIGETYFFREPAQLEFIRRTVLPELRERRGAGQPLRIWSAGCATGEEPYSLAVMLHEDWPQHRPRILGTELSHPRIAAARRARYTKWSLRSLAPPVIERYFQPCGKQFCLRPDIRSMVQFAWLNLVEDSYPGGSLELRDQDLVLCRNVLIYFDRPTVIAVVTRLLETLSDDGWLFLGASDPAVMEAVPAEVVVTGAGLAYRKIGVRRASVVAAGGPTAAPGVTPLGAAVTQPLYVAVLEDLGAPLDAPAAPPAPGEPGAAVVADLAVAAPGTAPAPVGVPDAAPSRAAVRGAGVDLAAGDAESARRAYAARDYHAAAAASGGALERRLARAQAAEEDEGALWVLRVRALANLGLLGDAGRACAAALERHPTHAELAFLHALLLAESGRLPAAERAARGALFLDRRLAVAHMLLGGIRARLGDRAAAARAFDNAAALLAQLPADAPVPASDGEPVHRVREAARAQRRLVAARPA